MEACNSQASPTWWSLGPGEGPLSREELGLREGEGREEVGPENGLGESGSGRGQACRAPGSKTVSTGAHSGPPDNALLYFFRARDGGPHAAWIPTPHPHQWTGQLCLFCHRRHGGR